MMMKTVLWMMVKRVVWMMMNRVEWMTMNRAVWLTMTKPTTWKQKGQSTVGKWMMRVLSHETMTNRVVVMMMAIQTT